MKPHTLVMLLALALPAALAAQEEGVDPPTADTCQRQETPLFEVLMPPATLGSYGPFRPWETWQLHEGVNARFSFGAATAFGKGSPRGVGLEERVDFAYAGRLGKRLSYALMVQGSNMTWGPMRRRDISLTGFVGYRASERFSLYAYVSKSLLHQSEGFSLGYLPPFSQPSVDRVGFVADWTIGENAWIQVAFEASRVKWEQINPFNNLHLLYGPPPMRGLNW